MKKFSDRMGITTPREQLQLDRISTELKNSIWNIIYNLYNYDYWRIVSLDIAQFFIKIPIDEVPYKNYQCVKWLKKYFYSLKWYDIYNFIEYIANNHQSITSTGSKYHKTSNEKIRKVLNSTFEKEKSGYRFIEDVLSPITNESEITSIEESINNANNKNFEGVREHLITSLELLSKKTNPDYRNSIKESISAVESIAAIIANDESSSLGKVLSILEKKTKLHSALKSGFKKLYGYTSDEDGIRHKILDLPNVSYAEAKYMLVSCSAFVNYLIQKGEELNLFDENKLC